MIRSLRSIAVTRPRRADGPYELARYGLLAPRRRRLRGASVDPSALASLASAIQTREGYYPGSVSYQNNNPGNLVYAGQPGASPGAGGFAQFSSYSAGYTALENQIQLDATRGTDVNGNPTTTVGQLVSSWAPASDGNDVAGYIASVTAQTGYSASDPLLSLGSPASSDSSSLSFDTSDSSDGIDAVYSDDSSSASPLLWLAIAAAALVVVRSL